jgi:hypothetical protein
MCRFKPGQALLYVLLVIFTLTWGHEGSCEGEKRKARGNSKERAAARSEKLREQELEKQIYDVFKKYGCINDPRFPFVVHVKRVEGTKLQFVQFMHRSPTGEGYDCVGKALEMQLKVDLARRLVLVPTRECNFRHSDDTCCYDRYRVWEFDLPGDLRFLQAKPAKEEPPLSPEDRRFLMEGCHTSPVDKKLQQAFGQECDELLRETKLEVSSGTLVLAADKPRETSDGRILLSSCSIARFGKKQGNVEAPVIATVRSKNAYMTVVDCLKLLNEYEDGTITLECDGGVRITFAW